jgi:iron complex outermembrane receptor protein
VNLTTRSFPRLTLTLALAAAFAGLAPAPRARAAEAAAAEAAAADGSGDQVTRLNEVEVSEGKVSALSSATTDSRLDTIQPLSRISVQTINNTIAPTADYATIANIAPSVANVETEGPGLSESKMLSMRGFQDGNYNVTFDGIPFGDANGPSHHSTSYFPAKILGGIDIDRGPGTASTIGEATFGGTIGLLSKDPRPDPAAVFTVSDGSYNTFLGNVEVNTGAVPQANGASMVFTYQYMSTDGYRTFSYMNRNTYYLKYVQPIGKETTLTVVGTYNNIKFNNPGAITQAQINTYGRNFGLTNNPLDPNNLYYPYNYQTKQADMEYIGLKSLLGADFHLDNKLYTYAYNNDSHESSVDPVPGGTTGFPNKAGNDPGGQYKVNAYRAWGDTLSVSHEDASLTEQAGVWGEYIRSPRYNYYLDYNPAYAAANPGQALPGGIIDLANAKSALAYKPGFSYFMHAYNKTFQPYAELTWRPLPNLSIDAGVKYSSFTIDLEAPVNQGTATPLFYNATYTKVLPDVSVNYRLASDWSVYAQAAEGYLYPNLSLLETVPNDPKDATPTTPTSVKGEQTWNYQIGTVYKTARFNADIDAYYINFSNYLASVTDPNDSANTLYFLAKGAYYSGVEAEGTFYVGGGFSVYANGSLNRATFKTNSGIGSFNVANVPNSTANYGFIYDHSGWFASLSNKYIGPFQVYSSALTNPDLGLYGQTSTGKVGGTATPVLTGNNAGFWSVSLAGGYGFKLPKGSVIHSLKLKVQLDNLLDQKVQMLNSVKASGNTFNVLPTNTFFITLSTEI